MKRLIRKAKGEVNKDSWQYKALEAAGLDMSRAQRANSDSSFYDVNGGVNAIEQHGYEYIKTNSNDYTAGSYTNGQYVITLVAAQGYVSISNISPKLKKFLQEHPDEEYDIFNN